MEISKKSRGKTVFVTGSHKESNEEYRKLGTLLAQNSEITLLSGQSAGVGSNVVAAFTEECIKNNTDIMNRIRIFPNPYAANKKYSDDPQLIPELKKCRAKTNNVRLKNGKSFIEVGKKTRTLVNCLLGANDVNTYMLEIRKIEEIKSLKNAFSKPDIITDLSIMRRKSKESLW